MRKPRSATISNGRESRLPVCPPCSESHARRLPRSAWSFLRPVMYVVCPPGPSSRALRSQRVKGYRSAPSASRESDSCRRRKGPDVLRWTVFSIPTVAGSAESIGLREAEYELRQAVRDAAEVLGGLPTVATGMPGNDARTLVAEALQAQAGHRSAVDTVTSAFAGDRHRRQRGSHSHRGCVGIDQSGPERVYCAEA